MAWQFKQHYTRDEARALLPAIRQWLSQLGEARSRLNTLDQEVESLVSAGIDAGGPPVNNWVRAVAAMKQALLQFQSREIQIKDPDRGLIDFPAIIGGREVFLCWEKDEDDIEFWHDLESGFAGRERL